MSPASVAPPFVLVRDVRLTRYVDGDTARFWLSDKDESVRFLFVNTEEVSSPRRTDFGRTSASEVREMLRTAGEISLAARREANSGFERDAFGRVLALVFTDGELLQARIVREGWSVYYTAFGCAPDEIHEALLWSEDRARQAGLGVWNPAHPSDTARALSGWIRRGRRCRPDPKDGPICPARSPESGDSGT